MKTIQKILISAVGVFIALGLFGVQCYFALESYRMESSTEELQGALRILRAEVKKSMPFEFLVSFFVGFYFPSLSGIDVDEVAAPVASSGSQYFGFYEKFITAKTSLSKMQVAFQHANEELIDTKSSKIGRFFISDVNLESPQQFKSCFPIAWGFYSFAAIVIFASVIWLKESHKRQSINVDSGKPTTVDNCQNENKIESTDSSVDAGNSITTDNCQNENKIESTDSSVEAGKSTTTDNCQNENKIESTDSSVEAGKSTTTDNCQNENKIESTNRGEGFSTNSQVKEEDFGVGEAEDYPEEKVEFTKRYLRGGHYLNGRRKGLDIRNLKVEQNKTEPESWMKTSYSGSCKCIFTVDEKYVKFFCGNYSRQLRQNKMVRSLNKYVFHPKNASGFLYGSDAEVEECFSVIKNHLAVCVQDEHNRSLAMEKEALRQMCTEELGNESKNQVVGDLLQLTDRVFVFQSFSKGQRWAEIRKIFLKNDIDMTVVSDFNAKDNDIFVKLCGKEEKVIKCHADVQETFH